MRRLMAAGLLALAATLASTGAGLAQQACDTYQVVRGDTLRNIARTAFGEPDYTQIYRDNRDAIGRNPNILRIGVILEIPCTGPSGAFAQTGAQGDPDQPPFTLITANDFAPYTDEALLDRGLVTQVVAMAMLRGNPQGNSEVVFVNDRAAHLETLLPRQAFDASFPWAKPGCETQGVLSASELYACQNYLYSQPLLESVEGFYALGGTGYDDAQTYDLLQGATICRPEGMSLSYLEPLGLLPPNVAMKQPENADDCFGLLAIGEVDVVALDSRAADVVLRQMNMSNVALQNPFLQVIEPLYAVIHKDNPNAQALLKTLNDGLERMQTTGEWASIVSQGLRQQTEVIMN